MKKLESLEDRNKRMRESYSRTDSGTGVECPNCKKELRLMNSNTLLLSMPPQQEVFCISCGYTGNMIV